MQENVQPVLNIRVTPLGGDEGGEGMKWNIKGSGLVLWACCLTLFSAAGAAPRNYVVQGDIVYTPACGEAKILPQGYLVVNEGKVQGAYDKLPQDYEGWPRPVYAPCHCAGYTGFQGAGDGLSRGKGPDIARSVLLGHQGRRSLLR